MADDLKISDMVEILTGDLHDDLQFEVIDPNEVVLADQNKRVKMVTLEDSFGAEDKIFKDDTLVQAFGTAGGDKVVFSMEEGDVGGVHQLFSVDGAAGNIYLGRVADFHVRMGTGSDPSFRAVSGSDIWMLLEPDRQQLGSSASGDAYVRVSPGTPKIEAWVNNVEVLDLAEIIQRIGQAADTNIELNQTNNTFNVYIEGFIAASFQGAAGLDIFRGDADTTKKGNIKVNGSNFQIANLIQGGNISFGAVKGAGGGVTPFFADPDSYVQLTYDGTIEFRTKAGAIEVHAIQFGIAGAGPIIDTFETALTDDDTHVPTSGAVFDAIPDYSAGFPVGGTTYGDGLITDDGSFRITIAAGSVLNFRDSDNDWLMSLASNGQLDFFANNQNVFSTKSNGINVKGNLNLGTGASVDTIETALTDDDTHIPTSGAVVDAIAAISLDIIQEGDSSVEVVDAGTGQINIKPDNVMRCNILAASGTFGWTDASFAYDYTNKKVVMQGDGGGPNQVYLELDAINDHLQFNIGTLGKKFKMTADGMELGGDQTGAEAIGNAATTVAITFGTAHADANYQVICTVENTIDGGPLVLAAIITAKATTGFTATLSAATDTVNYVLNWLVIRS